MAELVCDACRVAVPIDTAHVWRDAAGDARGVYCRRCCPRCGPPLSLGADHELETRCPYCGRINDRHAEVGSDDAPAPGSVAVCILCGGIAVFDARLELRMPTLAELDVIEADPRIVAALSALRRAHRPAW